MKQFTLAAAVLISLGLTACERPGPTVVTTPAPAPTVVTVPGPAGATGATGATGTQGTAGATGTPGEPGKTNTDTVVVVPARP
jgi:hypothetical protein